MRELSTHGSSDDNQGSRVRSNRDLSNLQVVDVSKFTTKWLDSQVLEYRTFSYSLLPWDSMTWTKVASGISSA